MTPFREAGHTEDTKFKSLIDYNNIKVGDIVTLEQDDGSSSPWFKTEDGRVCEMRFPIHNDNTKNELEVYEEPNVTL